MEVFTQSEKAAFRSEAYNPARARLKAGIKEVKRRHQKGLEIDRVAGGPEHHKLQKQERSHHV